MAKLQAISTLIYILYRDIYSYSICIYIYNNYKTVYTLVGEGG